MAYVVSPNNVYCFSFNLKAFVFILTHRYHILILGATDCVKGIGRTRQDRRIGMSRVITHLKYSRITESIKI